VHQINEQSQKEKTGAAMVEPPKATPAIRQLFRGPSRKAGGVANIKHLPKL